MVTRTEATKIIDDLCSKTLLTNGAAVYFVGLWSPIIRSRGRGRRLDIRDGLYVANYHRTCCDLRHYIRSKCTNVSVIHSRKS